MVDFKDPLAFRAPHRMQQFPMFWTSLGINPPPMTIICMCIYMYIYTCFHNNQHGDSPEFGLQNKHPPNFLKPDISIILKMSEAPRHFHLLVCPKAPMIARSTDLDTWWCRTGFWRGSTSRNPNYFDVHQGYKVLTHPHVENHGKQPWFRRMIYKCWGKAKWWGCFRWWFKASRSSSPCRHAMGIQTWRWIGDPGDMG